jgi:outer membrane protein OmpA-like peptidoglycan-associated protein
LNKAGAISGNFERTPARERMMGISRMRRGLFAGPIFIAAAISMAGAGAAQATCAEDIATFDKAVKSSTRDEVKRSYDNVSFAPGCKSADKVAARDKYVDFLIDYAGGARVSDDDRKDAIARAAKTLDVSGNWKGKQRLADYYYTQRDMVNAHFWYQESASDLSKATPEPTPKEKEVLVTRLAAAQSLANNDKEGKRSIATPPSKTKRDVVTGKVEGLFSDAFRPRGAVAIKVPVPIQFQYDKADFTQIGRQTMQELVDAAQQIQQMTAAAGTVPTMRLVGHADPRGDHRRNMELSKFRVLAVRDELVRQGVKADFKIEWVGDQEEFNWRLLPNASTMTDEDRYQLDRRVEWVRDGVPERDGAQE